MKRKSTFVAKKKIRYALIGAGHIAQNAVLPAFHNARKNSELTALFSSDQKKRQTLGRKYKIANVFGYEQFDEACKSDLFDVLYISLPNSMHAEYTLRAADAGIHVLCEKPMAVTSQECQTMINAAKDNRVKLMIAYRLHFEEANLKAVKIAQSGKLGHLRVFHSIFSMQVRNRNIRVEEELGGGPLQDIGIYCINAARYIFRSEPTEVVAASARGNDPRFAEVDEAISAVLRFPDERLASFTCSFGASDVSQYQVVGAAGNLRVDPAYEYEGELAHHLTIKDKTKSKTFKQRDQFAPELLYFSKCILDDLEPEPGGTEGLKDIRIIESILESLRTQSAVAIKDLPVDKLPSPSQQIDKKPPQKKELVHAESAHQ